MSRYIEVVVPPELVGPGEEDAVRYVVDTEPPSSLPTAIARAAEPMTGLNAIDVIVDALNASV